MTQTAKFHVFQKGEIAKEAPVQFLLQTTQVTDEVKESASCEKRKKKKRKTHLSAVLRAEKYKLALAKRPCRFRRRQGLGPDERAG